MGWGSDKPYPVKLEQLSTEQLGQISFLFGGVGDGEEDPALQECFSNDGRNITRFVPLFPPACPW